MREHWTARAERVSAGDWRILGEDDMGDFYVPCVHPEVSPEPQWHTRFDGWNLRHWPYWLLSRITKRIAFLERQ